MLNSRVPENSLLDISLHSGEKRSSSTHQKTGTSSPNQETLTSYWSNPTPIVEHTPQLRVTMNFQPAERVPQTQQSKQKRNTQQVKEHDSVQFSSVAQSCPTLCDPMNLSMPGLPVHHQLPEFTQTHVHQVSDAIQPSHPLSSPSPPAPNPSQHQSLFQ